MRRSPSEFIDRLVARAPECDFVSEIASWYPLRVVMTLLGVPKEDEAILLNLTKQIFDDSPAEEGEERKSKAETVQAFFDYFRPIVEDRRANPQGDIASKIANASINGKALNDFETYSYFLTLATAGHDTTSSSIAGGLLALIEFPEEMRKLRENPALFDTLPDEMMRWDAPVKHFFRTASEDCELAGQAIRAGDSIYLAFPSGGRDEAMFDAPDASASIGRTIAIWHWAQARMHALASISPVWKYACSSSICLRASTISNLPDR